MNPEKNFHEGYENNNGLEASVSADSEVVDSSEKKVNELSNVNLKKDDSPIINSIPVVMDNTTSDSTKDDNSLKTTYPSVTLLAKDKDLIEKEWVMKAKKIIEQTKENPHKQEEEINILKAEYKEKRYGKDLNLAS